MRSHTAGWAVPVATCALCGHCDADVKPGLIRWAPSHDVDPGGDAYGYAPRCRDHDACHGRCMAAGTTWLAEDGRPLPPPAPRTPPPAPAEPEPLDFGVPPEEAP